MKTEVTFGHFPILETERLRLRQLEPKDAERMYANFTDEEVLRYFGMEPLKSIEEAREMIASRETAFNENRSIRWGITDKATGRLLGTCGFHSWDKEDLRVEIGYELAREHWGQGYMTEALRPVLAYGFAQMQVNRIEALIDARNTSSRKLAERLGLQFEGVLRQYLVMRGVPTDTAVYAILREDVQ